LNVLGEHATEDLEYAMTPRVNLLQPENATAWIFARLTIQNFGERFRFRTDTYMGKSNTFLELILVFVVLIISILFDAVYEIEHQKAFIGALVLTIMLIVLASIAEADNREAEYMSELFVLAFVTVTVYLSIVVGITLLGTSVNTELANHW
jgi:hypothetical protein